MIMIPFDKLKDLIDGDLYLDLYRRRLLSTDGSIFEQIPAAVAYPRTTEDVRAIVLFARDHGLPVHARGAGSGVCGASLGRGIVVDFTTYMNRLKHLDVGNRWFECEPGYRMGELLAALKGTDLFFPPDPSSGEYATFGGMVATNASGAHSVKYGNVGDYCLDATIVLADGQVVTLSGVRAVEREDLSPQFQALHDLYTRNAGRIQSAYPPVRHNSTGYNLRHMVDENGRLNLTRLFSGAEGTLGIVTRLKFSLRQKNKHDILIVAYFKDIVPSARATQQILPLGPCGIEIMDRSLLDLARQRDDHLDRLLPGGVENLLLIAFDEALQETCRDKAHAVKQILSKEQTIGDIHIAFSEQEKAGFWSIRKAAVPILYKMKGKKKVLPLIEDAVVPTDRLVPYFEGIYRILGELKVQFVVFGHIAKGLLHTRPLLNLKTREDTALLKTISDRIFELVYSLGGAISGEHGDGRIRSVYIRDQYPDIFPLFERVKDILDPLGRFNPDIITGAQPDPPAGTVSENYRFAPLRYGEAYRAKNPYGKVLFPPGDLVLEIEKCHGCSKCTTVTHATRMCPVYKVLRDEAAAPKAKANILRSLVSGRMGAMDRHVFARGLFHVLDHCINCGSCSHECPSEVDIPKMVLEAKAACKKRFGVTLADRILTSARQGERLTRPFSGLASGAMENPALRRLGEKIAGISAQRTITPFAARPLSKRLALNDGQAVPRVLYFAGCDASLIRPEIGEAAAKALRAAGFSLVFPPQDCCGLPMISKGMGNKALKTVEKNLSLWLDQALAVDHIVTTCSSCLLSLTRYWAWFADSGQIRPDSRKALALKIIQEKTVHISRLLLDHQDSLNLKSVNLSVAYHTPCHLKAGPHAASSVRLLEAIPGLVLDNMTCHCCGMAGTWGMMAQNYDLSNRIGLDLKECLNRSAALAGATDCPTCRMQMASFSDKPVLHPVEILARSL